MKKMMLLVAVAALIATSAQVTFGQNATSATPSPEAMGARTGEKHVLRAFERVAKHHPWVNSLGMKFVPVVGTQVLFSVWDTRVQDFMMFERSTGYEARASGSVNQGSTYPVVLVSWNDAHEFCKWLTKRERSAGDLPQEREYRLPTDEEWSAAVGLKDEVGCTAEEKNGQIKLYPWDIPHKRDKSWPPPAGAGNYAGEEAKIGDWFSESEVIKGYNDSYSQTSPVGSFPANEFGLYDMGGNVLQWCEDWYNAQVPYRVLRGASWVSYNPDALLASSRLYFTPDARSFYIGFRCVVAVESAR